MLNTQFKNRHIYLLSSLPSDENLDQIKLTRMKMDESMHLGPIKVNELNESVCRFDNIGAISVKKDQRLCITSSARYSR